jgi:single-stranded DNA-specific DHH superfamily exonuclease
MLTKKQIKEIKEHLEKAQNPIFFFDNDPDGLCSFLLLQRYIKRGKGVAIKSFPEMTAEYFRKVSEFNADYIFILDKPVVSNAFFEEVKSFNIPVVWIDHHDVQTKIPEFIYYYNTSLNRFKKNEPVTYLCYKVTERKEDLWLAVVGCIFDRYIPDFYSEFVRLYPDLAIKSKDAFDIFYKSKIGKIVKMFCFALKDRTSNVVKMIKFLSTIKTPYEVLEETSKNREMHSRFKQIYKKYEKLLEKAKKLVNEDKVLFFQYAGDLSISADLSNELSYLFPDKIIVVVYIQGVKGNVSARGKNVRDIILKAIEGLEGATGGGHKNAVGAQVRVEDLEKFRENIEKLTKNLFS